MGNPHRRSRLLIPALAFLQLFFVNCGGGGGGSKLGSSLPVGQPVPPTFAFVALVVLENHSFSDVIGNSSMPYLNGLAQKYGLAAQSYANTHPSLPNYLMLTVGQLETADDSFSGVVSDDNVVREVVNGNKSWKAYVESLPSVGYMGDDVYPYRRDHNPFVYLSDVQNSAAQAANVVPFTQFATDLGGNTLPQYMFVVPNVLDDAHDGTLAQADSWLQQNIAPLIASAAFQNGGLLVITFDEGKASDSTNGGGHIATVIVSSQSKQNYVSQTMFQHQSTLQLTLAGLGVTTFPGEAATAPSMAEFFNTQ